MFFRKENTMDVPETGISEKKFTILHGNKITNSVLGEGQNTAFLKFDLTIGWLILQRREGKLFAKRKGGAVKGLPTKNHKETEWMLYQMDLRCKYPKLMPPTELRFEKLAAPLDNCFPSLTEAINTICSANISDQLAQVDTWAAAKEFLGEATLLSRVWSSY